MTDRDDEKDEPREEDQDAAKASVSKPKSDDDPKASDDDSGEGDESDAASEDDDESDEKGDASEDDDEAPSKEDEEESKPNKRASESISKSKSASATNKLSETAKKDAAKKPAPRKQFRAAEPEGKSGWLTWVAVAVVAAAAVTVWQTKKANDEARMRVETACAKIRPLEDKRIKTMKAAIHNFYGDDASRLDDALDGARIAPTCDALPSQLSSYGWNYGKTWTPPKSKAAQAAPTADEIHDIMQKSKPTCEKKVGDMLAMLDSLGGDNVPEETRQDALMMCDPSAFAQQLTPTAEKPETELTLLEGWPRYLEGYAAALEKAETPTTFQ